MSGDDKKISFTGINNRYQIKKLTEKPKITKKKNTILTKILETSKEDQKTILQEWNNENEKEEKYIEFKKLFNNALVKKISSYKQQDIIKNKLNTEMLINKDEVIHQILESELKCYYCKEELYLLYENQREKKQWTLDRINNDLGHNRDNVVISCLECNLKRRNTNKDAFIFTKQLNIIKKEG